MADYIYEQRSIIGLLKKYNPAEKSFEAKWRSGPSNKTPKNPIKLKYS